MRCLHSASWSRGKDPRSGLDSIDVSSEQGSAACLMGQSVKELAYGLGLMLIARPPGAPNDMV